MLALVFSSIWGLSGTGFDPWLRSLELLEPVAISPADTPQVALRKQRFNETVAWAKGLYADLWRCINCWRDRVAWIRVLEIPQRVADAGAAIETSPADRLKWYEWRVWLAWSLERKFKYRVQAGVAAPPEGLQAQAARIDAEIALLEFQEALKARK